jgi:hypothetical protein
MMTRLLAIVPLRHLLPQPPQATVATARHARPNRRQLARLAVAYGLLSFALATVGLIGVVEVAKPEWRDPEFFYRVKQLHRWKAEAPDRPLVLAFGSSRTQMGLSPAVMNFPNEPGVPLVYNCGYRGAHPVGVLLHVTRYLDHGPRPDYVLIQLAAADVGIPGTAEAQLKHWASRLSPADWRRLGPYTADSTTLPWKWATSRLNAWVEFQTPILSNLLPSWQPRARQLEWSWERMDGYGFAPMPKTRFTPAERKQALARTRELYQPTFQGRPWGPTSDQAYRDIIARCQAEGIPVAFFVAPESPSFRSWYSPLAREMEARYHQLIQSLGVPVFPMPPHLTDEDFADGFHLIRSGAEKYSRWLAEHHLKPWLASQGLRVTSSRPESPH